MASSPSENPVTLTTTPTSTPVPGYYNQTHETHQNSGFSITQEKLAELLLLGHDTINSNHHDLLHKVASALETHLEKGIPGDHTDLSRRHTAFGPNLDHYHALNNDGHKLYSLTAKGLCTLCIEAFKDPTAILLLCCAALSLVLSIKRNGPVEGISDGAMLFLAIFIVVNFGSACKLFKARVAKHLRRRRAKNVVLAVRDGNPQTISVSQIVVGDILCLKRGDQIPVDGLLFYNQDDSKSELDHIHGLQSMNYKLCEDFIFSGMTVAAENLRMLVTSVGKNTEISKLMGSVSHDQNEGPILEVEIETIKSRLEHICLRISLLILVVQLIRCFRWEAKYCDENQKLDPRGLKNTVEEIMNRTTQQLLKNRQSGSKGTNYGLVPMLCVLIFALRDGLPLGTLILFAYASNKMKSIHGTMVQKLPTCATVGLVTTICTSLTGDLTLDPTKMASLWIGSVDGTLKQVQLVEVIKHSELLEALREGVCMNSSGLDDQDVLSWWAKEGLGVDHKEVKQSRTILPRETFDRDENLSGLLLRRKGEVGNSVHVHLKGRPGAVLSMCSHYYDATEGTMEILDEQKRVAFNEVIERLATVSSDRYECFALAYKRIVLEEKEGNTLKLEEEECLHQDTALNFVGVVALKNPYPTQVREAIKRWHELGVKINLFLTGDLQKARFMANQSGILNQEENISDGAVIEASEFRNSSKEDRKKIVDKFRIMVNCTPLDKLLMVQGLKEKGEVVVAIGSSIRDCPVLKEADVGLFLNSNAASEIGNENADMVMSELNLATVRAAYELGWCVCNNLVKFLQLQLTLNAVSFTLNSLVVFLSSTEGPLSAFQLLWVNLVMDVLGALALSTSIVTRVNKVIPADSVHQTGQVYKRGPILTKKMWMWRSFTIQYVYQVTVLVTLYMKGKAILHVDRHVDLKAMIFTCYFLCQVFGLINARKGEGSIGHENLFRFIAILGCILILQAAAVEIQAVVGHGGKLSLEQWCICIGIGSFSLLIDSIANGSYSFIANW